MTWIYVECLSVLGRFSIRNKWVCVFIYCAPNNYFCTCVSCRCVAFIHTILNVFTFAFIVFVVVTILVYYFLDAEWDGTFGWARTSFFSIRHISVCYVLCRQMGSDTIQNERFFFSNFNFFIFSQDVCYRWRKINTYSKNIRYESRNWESSLNSYS